MKSRLHNLSSIRYVVVDYRQSTTLLISLQWLIYLALVGHVVADVLIATSICVLLYKSRSGFKSYVLFIAFFPLFPLVGKNFEHVNQVGFIGYHPYDVQHQYW